MNSSLFVLDEGSRNGLIVAAVIFSIWLYLSTRGGS